MLSVVSVAKSRRVLPVVLCVAMLLGCASTLKRKWATLDYGDLAVPQLLDDSIICEDVQWPKMIYFVDRECPEFLAREQVDGYVVVEYVVTVDGTVRDPSLVRASDPRLANVVFTLAESRYQPGLCDGVPVEMKVQAARTYHTKRPGERRKGLDPPADAPTAAP